MDWRTPSPGDAYVGREEQRVARREISSDDPGCDAIDRSVSPEKWEREVERMEAEDTSMYWDHGRTYP